MFDAASHNIKTKVEEWTHVDLDHASTQEKVRVGAALAFGAAVYAVAEQFHVSKPVANDVALKAANLVTSEKIVAGAEKIVADTEKLSAAEWLDTLPKPEVARALSPHLQHVDALAARLHTAFRQDGDVLSNVESALNAHSAEFFPYVRPVSVKMAEENDMLMHAQGNTIFVHGKIERTANGEAEFEYKSQQAAGESGLAASFGHEYNHVEQTNHLQLTRTSESITEGQYQRSKRIVDSLQKDSAVELSMLKAENEYYSLRNVEHEGKKSMVEANTIRPTGSDFTPFYTKVMNLPDDDMPPTFKAFVDKQNALRASALPHLSDHDLGRQFYLVLRGQIATAKSRALMTYKSYQGLYHEVEAFQLEDAIKSAYGAAGTSK